MACEEVFGSPGNSWVYAALSQTDYLISTLQSLLVWVEMKKVWILNVYDPFNPLLRVGSEWRKILDIAFFEIGMTRGTVTLGTRDHYLNISNFSKFLLLFNIILLCVY